MTVQFPPVDRRRRLELFAELLERARAILPEVRPAHPDHEWLRGLLDITARIETAVTSRLDKVPAKDLRNFFDWLGTLGRAARAARLVSVFRRAPATPQQPLEPLLVPPRARLQAQTDTGSVVFETLQDLRIFPGGVVALVAVDSDKIYQPPPGLFDPAAPPPAAMLRRLKSAAPAGSPQIQVSPALGLQKDDIIAIGGQQYRVVDVKGDLISIDPPLAALAADQATLEQVTSFAPFGSAAIATPHDWQEHVLYIGDDDLLNVEAPATITVESTPLLEGATWSYWGKTDGSKASDPPTWLPLTAEANNDGIALTKKDKGAIEKFDVDGQQSRVLRAIRPADGTLVLGAIKLKIASPTPISTSTGAGGSTSTGTQSSTTGADTPPGCPPSVAFEGIANVAPIPSPDDFYPLGLAPRLFDSFYVGCAEAFSKQGAHVMLSWQMDNATLGPLAAAFQGNATWAFGVGKDGLMYRLAVTPSPSPALAAPPSVDWTAFRRPTDAPSAGGAQIVGGRVVSFAPAQRPAVISHGKTSIAAYGGSEVWWLDEVPAEPDKAQWRSLGTVGDKNVTATVTATAVLQAGSTLHAFAARGGKLFEQAVGAGAAQWNADSVASPPDGLRLIAPFSAVGSNPATYAYADGIIATSETGVDPSKQRKLHLRRGIGSAASWKEVISKDVVPDVLPLGIQLASGTYLMVAAVQPSGGTQQLVAVQDNSGTFTTPVTLDLGTKVLEPSLSFVRPTAGAMPVVVFVAGEPDGSRSLGLWRPGLWPEAVYIDAPPAGHALSQGAAIIAGAANGIALEQLVIPGTDADVLAAGLKSDSFTLTLTQTGLRNYIVAAQLQTTADRVEVDDGTNRRLYVVGGAGAVIDLGNGSAAYRLGAGAAPVAKRCRLFKLTSGPWQASNVSSLTFTLDSTDTNAAARTDFVAINYRVYELASISGTTATLVAGSLNLPSTTFKYRYLQLLSGLWQASNGSSLTFTLDPNDTNPAARTNFVSINYQVYQISISGTTATLVGSPSIPTSFKYRYLQLPPQNDPSFIAAETHAIIYISALPPDRIAKLAGEQLIVQQAAPILQLTDPELQEVSFLSQPAAWAVLKYPWKSPPPSGQVQFYIPPTSFDPWQWLPYRSPSNPALSWEYWNGTGWWKLLVTDGTHFLRDDGTTEFDVPTDIKPTDVLGRTNHWIRARLVGGDYGQESFTVQTQGTTQTFQRNSDSIHAPRAICLSISYAIAEGQFPARVVTRDNLAWRDQSAANRAPNAVLELFQPFSAALAELKATPTTAPPAADDCCEVAAAVATPAPCSCQQSQGTTAAAAPGSLATGAPSAAAATAGSADVPSALFLGTDVQLEGGSVRILWDVDEQPQDTELLVEALHDGAFAKVLYQDETNGLAETGILTLTFDQPPGLSDLFGQARYWLRLRPKTPDPTVPWQPVIKRVCLNAAWAEAAESQDMEMLGSSDGSPNLTVSIARPPVLDQSLEPGVSAAPDSNLELRVAEPLTDDEVVDLRRADPSVVRDNVPTAPGTWVRWTRVVDPLDAAPGDRVFSLDETTGDIKFGDALHGAVPPPGRNNIMAIKYRRGGGAAANQILAGAALGLVSPLAGVEGVVGGTGAAGGADAAAVEETLQRAPAMLWARDRAITSRDVEQLALAYAPEIVQARCVAGPRAALARLIVVLSGQNPSPTRSARHELQRYLLDRATPALADGLRVDAPRTKPCRIEVALTIDSLDRGGTIEQTATDALRGLLHWASGGLDGGGWPLGAVPGADDLAAVLVDIPGVLGIGAIALFDADATGDVPFPATVPDDTLVMLATNGVHVTLTTEDGA